MLRSILCLAVILLCVPAQAEPAFGQGIMVGEVTETTAVVQVRVTDGMALVDGDTFDDGDALRDGDQAGVETVVTFIVPNEAVDGGLLRVNVRATEANDYIVRYKLRRLKPGKTYTVRAEISKVAGGAEVYDQIEATFQTLSGPEQQATTRFHVVTGMNYDKFIGNERQAGYQGEDRALGFPAYDAMRKLEPDFVVYTGDDVYYDKIPRVQTLQDMRAKWHRQFSRPRFIELSGVAPGYWMKDDHDHRTNDSDAEGDGFPSHELGIETFREQVPIVAQDDDTTPTYRTHRVSKDLQIWMLEGRDYRSPNKMEDGPDKTLWGAEQLAWLKRTLLESDATYKMIISPTPMVGPDDGYKSDNHTNPRGFKHEGDAFKQWATEQKLWENGTYFLCGDRHWQYHSIGPSGAHEFSCGAICDANSRLGQRPGAAKSTDPEGLITQPYTQKQRSGGFLSVVCTPGQGDKPASIRFEFYDEQGEQLYTFDPAQ